MDAIDCLRAFFLLAAATVRCRTRVASELAGETLSTPLTRTIESVQTVSVSILPSLRARFLVYGPRATSPGSPSRPSQDAPAGLLDYLATWRVPHSYFVQFYLVSVASSAFWAVQFLCRGSVSQAIATRVSEEHRLQSMTLSQVVVCWLLLALQGCRRLWESYTFAKPSSSQMWFVHWLLGLGFYLAAGVAIWIEGSGMVGPSVHEGIGTGVANRLLCRSDADPRAHPGREDHQRPQPADFPLRAAVPDRLGSAA